jgi:hypothetical protein
VALLLALCAPAWVALGAEGGGEATEVHKKTVCFEPSIGLPGLCQFCFLIGGLAYLAWCISSLASTRTPDRNTFDAITTLLREGRSGEALDRLRSDITWTGRVLSKAICEGGTTPRAFWRLPHGLSRSTCLIGEWGRISWAGWRAPAF